MDPIALTFLIIGSILLGLLIISFIAGTILIYFSNHHNHTYQNLSDIDRDNLPPEFLFSKDPEWFKKDGFFDSVSIQSFDKKKISAFFHRENSHLYIVFAHGYTGSPGEKAHCLHDLYDKYHCNMISVEQRGQTNSEIKYLTMGYKEGKDLASWADYIVSLDKDASIIFFGESMGAATVLTGLHFNYNKNVKGVIADSSYSSIHSEYMFIGKRMVPSFLTAFVVFGSIMAYFVIHHMRTIKYSPLNAIRKKSIPLCIIHGEEDKIVSYNSFVKFKENVHPETYSVFESFPKTGHVAAYFTDTSRYLTVLQSFINKVK